MAIQHQVAMSMRADHTAKATTSKIVNSMTTRKNTGGQWNRVGVCPGLMRPQPHSAKGMTPTAKKTVSQGMCKAQPTQGDATKLKGNTRCNIMIRTAIDDAGIIASAKTDAGSGFCLSEKYDLNKGSA
jgi:hypothetical protein